MVVNTSTIGLLSITAIIDSGVDKEHPALKGKVQGGISFIASRDFQGSGSIVQNIGALREYNPNPRTADQEKELQKMLADLQAEIDETNTKLTKAENSLNSAITACEKDPTASDCKKIADLKNKATRFSRQLKYQYNINYDPYKSLDPLKTNPDITPGDNSNGINISEHGIFLAGIIAGQRNAVKGFNGIAENARLIVIKVSNTADEAALEEQVAEGVRYSVDHNAKIINISLGACFSMKPELMLKAFDYANEHGVSVILSAGNEGKDLRTTVHYPNPSMDQKNVFVIGSD